MIFCIKSSLHECTDADECKSKRLPKKPTAENLYRKSYLRIIYDWLKGLYLIQTRYSQNNFGKPTSFGVHSLSASLNQKRESVSMHPSSSASTLLSNNPSANISPLQQQQQQQQIQSPVALSTTCLSSLAGSSSSSSATTATSSFILRKKFNYLTKYNLTNLLRDFEVNLRDTCKCDISTSYYAYKTLTDLKKMNKKSRNSSSKTLEDEKAADNVFLEDLKLLDRKENNADTKKGKKCALNWLILIYHFKFQWYFKKISFWKTRFFLRSILN